MLSRRRFLSVSASALGLPLAAGLGETAPRLPPVHLWRGTAMGADATIRLVHPDAGAARRLIDVAVAEIGRLEQIFSLHRDGSALSRLNRAGMLEAPPLELVELLEFAATLSERSGGAFDATVQPLFLLYLEHFGAADADPAGPAPAAIEAALRRVGHRMVDLTTARIAFRRPGMGVTLNGVAQGYVTDRVADLLRAEGCDRILLDLGEARAVGRRPDGRAWRAAVADPRQPRRTLFELDLDAGTAALATSGGYGARFDAAGRHHHLFDPTSGRSARHHASVSVATERAVIADALSTALSILPTERARSVLAAYRPARAYFVSSEGALNVIEAA